MKILLLYDPKHDPHGYMKYLFSSVNKFTVVEMQVVEENVLSVWNSNLNFYDAIVSTLYQIDEMLDIEAIERFIECLISENKNLFYMPRPNSYVNINRYAIIGTSNKCRILTQPIKKRLLLFIKKYASKYLSRKQKSSLAQKYNRLIRFEQKISCKFRVCSEISKQPCTKIPDLIGTSKEAWHEWKDRLAMSRDLVDRIHLYFPHPLAMHVAVANKCNLRCIMCPYHSDTYKDAHTTGYFDDEKFLDIAIFKRLASYAGKNGISLQFGQIEEPLLHPHIFDFISYAKKQGVPYIHLTTNGTLLSNDNAKKLAYSGIDSVMFSIDSVDQETYKSIRGASLGKLERNIDYFLPIAKKTGIRVTASFIRQQLSLTQKDEFLEKWKYKGVDAVTFYVLTEHNKSNGEFIRTEQFRDEEIRYPCASPWYQSVIMPDGTVGLCCKTMSDIGWKITNVGNISHQGFDEIWTGEQYRIVRNELLLNKFEIFTVCRKCLIWSASTHAVEYFSDSTRTYNETMETYTFI